MFIHSIIMLRFWESERGKEKFSAAKKSIKIRDVNAENIKKKVKKNLLISWDKATRPLILIIPKMSEGI